MRILDGILAPKNAARFCSDCHTANHTAWSLSLNRSSWTFFCKLHAMRFAEIAAQFITRQSLHNRTAPSGTINWHLKCVLCHFTTSFWNSKRSGVNIAFNNCYHLPGSIGLFTDVLCFTAMSVLHCELTSLIWKNILVHEIAAVLYVANQTDWCWEKEIGLGPWLDKKILPKAVQYFA